MTTISLRVSDELVDEVNRHADALHITRTEYIRRAVDNQRLVDGPLAQCPKTLMEEVDRCLLEVFGLGEFG